MSVDSDRSEPDALRRYPSNFEEWPLDDQLIYVAGEFRRGGLAEAILRLCDLEPDRNIATDTKLTKKELAAVYLTLEGIDHDRD